MSPTNDTSRTGDTQQLEKVAIYGIQIAQLSTLVQELRETNEGTIKTTGMKAKMAIAEMNIEANKQAYRETQDALRTLEDKFGRSLVEATSSITATLTKKIDDKFNDLKTSIENQGKENQTQSEFIKKITPWISAIQWVITGAAGIIMMMILTGKLNIAFAK